MTGSPDFEARARDLYATLPLWFRALNWLWREQFITSAAVKATEMHRIEKGLPKQVARLR